MAQHRPKRFKTHVSKLEQHASTARTRSDPDRLRVQRDLVSILFEPAPNLDVGLEVHDRPQVGFDFVERKIDDTFDHHAVVEYERYRSLTSTMTRTVRF